MEKWHAILIGCLIAVCGSGCLVSNQVSVSIDKYVENQDNARKEADKARKEWECRRREKTIAETAQLKKLCIPDLAKVAIDILVRTEDPQFIVNRAIDSYKSWNGGNLDGEPAGVCRSLPGLIKGSDPEKNGFGSIVYRKALDKDHDWWIEQNNVLKQYRLVGNPNQHIYCLIYGEQREDILRRILFSIVLFGNRKSFYQVVTDVTVVPKDGCEALLLEEAGKIFPETKSLGEGIYTKHPCNRYALVPLADYHASLAMDKATECVVLLGKMGAKSVRVSRVQGEKRGLEGGVGASYEGYNANINAKLTSGLKSKMDLMVEFSGASNVDVSPVLLANSIWHKSDAQLNGILQAINSGNEPKEWHFVEEGQSDFTFDLKAAAGVLGIAEGELKAKFEKSRETQREFHVTF